MVVSSSEAGGYSGTFTYQAATDSFGPESGFGASEVAVSRDGTLIASTFPEEGSVSIDSSRDNHLIHTFSRLGGGIAFDPGKDRLYCVSEYYSAIIAFNTITYAEEFRLPIGDYIVEPVYVSHAGKLVISNDSKYLALSTGSGVRVFSTPERPLSTVSPRFESPTNFVFDRAGKYLYIGTRTGFVWPYDLSTRQLGSPYNLGGSLRGMDISADDSSLYVAQLKHGLSQSAYHKINLLTGEISAVNYDLDVSLGEFGSWDIAIGSKGLALTTSHILLNSGWSHIRQIDTATDTISIRPNSGAGAGVGTATPIFRSADRTRFVLPIVNNSTGPIFRYLADSDALVSGGNKFFYWSPRDMAVNRNGELFAFTGGVTTEAQLETVSNFETIHTLPGANGGVAFDAVTDVLYALSTGGSRIGNYPSEVVAYDTTTYGEKFRISVGEQMPNYTEEQFSVTRLAASQDSKYLALITPTTVRVFDLASRSVTALPSAPAVLTNSGRLTNISTRAFVGTDDGATIAGFIILGSGPTRRQIVVRGIGPSLAAFGVSNSLQDPTLELHDSSGAVIATNDDWIYDPQAAAVDRLGLRPKDLHESAIYRELPPGAYTVVMRGKAGSTGVGLVEVYSIEPIPQVFGNISTRGFVGTGDNVLIAGVIVDRSDVHVLLRAIGPSLVNYAVANALADPTLELHDSNGTLVSFNDDWQDTQKAELWNTGIPPTNPKESSITLSLNPGSYTAIIRGKDDTSGVGLVEVYYLPSR